MRLVQIFFLLFSFGALAESDEMRVHRSRGLFNEAAKVLQHPRCLNCHPAGERPSMGLFMKMHSMNVKRGSDDHGATAMRCTTCHQEQNNDISGVPGNPRWALAPKEMAWQGLTKGQLCRKLKDKNSTHRTLEEMIDHNAHDDLVAWGWKPGKGREPAPFTQEKFGEIFRAWVNSGAECPEG